MVRKTLQTFQTRGIYVQNPEEGSNYRLIIGGNVISTYPKRALKKDPLCALYSIPIDFSSGLVCYYSAITVEKDGVPIEFYNNDVPGAMIDVDPSVLVSLSWAEPLQFQYEEYVIDPSDKPWPSEYKNRTFIRRDGEFTVVKNWIYNNEFCANVRYAV
jgi:hypothetical protein